MEMAYVNRGSAYLYLEQYDRALADFNKAIGLNPQVVEAYYNRGIIYRIQGKIAEAIADFEKVIDTSYNPQIIDMAEQQIEEIS